MKPVNTLLYIAAALTIGLSSSIAQAHTDEYLATQKAANGGQLRVAGIYHLELVVAKDGKEAKERSVVVHVTDHAGSKVSTVGAGGTATILAGKKKTIVKLVPDGDNRLKGSGSYISAADMKVVVSVAMPGKAVENARFTPLAATGDGHTDHTH